MQEAQEKEQPGVDGPHGGLRGHEEEDRRCDWDAHEHRELRRERPPVHGAAHSEVVADDAPEYAADARADDLERGDQAGEGAADANVLKVHGRKGHSGARDRPKHTLGHQHEKGRHPHVGEEFLRLVQQADALWPPRPRLLVDAHDDRDRDQDAHHRNPREGHPPTGDAHDLLACERGHYDERQGLPDRHVAEVDASEAEAHLGLCRHLRDDGLDNRREQTKRNPIQRAEHNHEVEGLHERERKRQQAPHHRACG
mmetsp:Transcript_57463/g.166897  ORF Transcript_57463/g.166897 Transcript_57463/m.166897 type:complete len:255 (+) Transcript_57463:485-1249(+)